MLSRSVLFFICSILFLSGCVEISCKTINGEIKTKSKLECVLYLNGQLSGIKPLLEKCDKLSYSEIVSEKRHFEPLYKSRDGNNFNCPNFLGNPIKVVDSGDCYVFLQGQVDYINSRLQMCNDKKFKYNVEGENIVSVDSGVELDKRYIDLGIKKD